MPRWKPAYKNGKPVKCNYIFPVVNGNGFIKQNHKYYNNGVILLNEGKLIESISYFNNALLFNENDFDSYYNTGVCYYKMQDINNACLYWGKGYLINNGKKSIDIINKFCDSTIEYKGERKKLSALNKSPDNKIHTVVEQMPSFPGGEEQLMQFLSKVRYPQQARENGISGRVYITFIIDENGVISDPKVLRGIGGGCDEAALEVIKKMPPWNPGKQDGIPTRVQFNLPINFNMR